MPDVDSFVVTGDVISRQRSKGRSSDPGLSTAADDSSQSRGDVARLNGDVKLKKVGVGLGAEEELTRTQIFAQTAREPAISASPKLLFSFRSEGVGDALE